MSETGDTPGLPRRRSTTPTTTSSCRCRAPRSGTAWPRLLRRPALQRLPGRATSARTARTHCSIDKIGQGHRRARRAARHRPPARASSGCEAGEVITPTTSTRRRSARAWTVGPGDILLFRTGWRTKFLSGAATRRRSWPASPASAWPAASGCTSARSPRSCSDNWAIEVLPGEDDDACSRCTWCSSATWA